MSDMTFAEWMVRYNRHTLCAKCERNIIGAMLRHDGQFWHPACWQEARAEKAERERDEARAEIALLREGIEEVLAIPELDAAARIPLLGCSMKPLPITEDDIEWASHRILPKEAQDAGQDMG